MNNSTETEIATLRQINATSALPNSLPHELLAEIFSLACPPIDFSERALCESDGAEDFFHIASMAAKSDTYPTPRYEHDLSHRYLPLTLSAVCHRWREVALSSPGLWSTFAIEVVGWKLKSQVPLLRFYLTNTGSLPFSLDLDIRLQQSAYVLEHITQTPTAEWEELKPLANLIFQEFPEKIRTLRVAGAPPRWMCFLSQWALPNLQDLTFIWGEEIGHHTTVTIKEGAFFMEPYSALRPVPGLPPLTVLHLRNVYTDICAKILLLCPHLVEYYCYAPASPPTNFLPNPPLNYANPLQRPVTLKEPFTLPNLKRFGWASQDEDVWNIALLENIRLPNLEELQWSGFPQTDPRAEEVDVIFRFFSNLPKMLRSFAYYNYDLAGDPDGGRNHYRLLSHFPHLQSLAFHRCSTSFLISNFYLLAEMDSIILLPGLDKIMVRNYLEDEDGLDEALVEMLEKRRLSLGISHFTFEAVDCVVRWGQDTSDGRRGELADGFSVTVEGKVDSYFPLGELSLRI